MSNKRPATGTWNRRSLLKVTGTGLAAGLAGCLGGGDGDGGDGGGGDGGDGEMTEEPFANYPEERLLWINPTSPGGGFGTIGQYLTEHLPGYLPNTNAEIEFRTIDNWIEGVQQIARADPDGYTFGWGNVPGNVPTQVLQGIPYRIDEWTYICTVANFSYTFVVAPDAPYQGLEDLQNAGTLKIGGTGGTGQLSAIIATAAMGIDIELVPGYGSSVEAINALQRGELDLQSMARRSVPYMQNLEDGNVRPILTLGDEPTEQTKNAGFGDIQTAQGLGYEDLRNFGLNRILGFPPETPTDVRDVLEESMIDLMESDTVQSWSEETGNPISPQGHEHTERAVQSAFTLVENNRDILEEFYG